MEHWVHYLEQPSGTLLLGVCVVFGKAAVNLRAAPGRLAVWLQGFRACWGQCLAAFLAGAVAMLAVQVLRPGGAVPAAPVRGEVVKTVTVAVPVAVTRPFLWVNTEGDAVDLHLPGQERCVVRQKGRQWLYQDSTGTWRDLRSLDLKLRPLEGE